MNCTAWISHQSVILQILPVCCGTHHYCLFIWDDQGFLQIMLIITSIVPNLIHKGVYIDYKWPHNRILSYFHEVESLYHSRLSEWWASRMPTINAKYHNIVVLIKEKICCKIMKGSSLSWERSNTIILLSFSLVSGF